MAIISNEVDGRGFVFENQYIRVDRINTTKTEMEIEVGVYLDSQNTDVPHRTHILRGEFNLYSEMNLWQQAYEHVKKRWTDYQDI